MFGPDIYARARPRQPLQHPANFVQVSLKYPDVCWGEKTIDHRKTRNGVQIGADLIAKAFQFCPVVIEGGPKRCVEFSLIAVTRCCHRVPSRANIFIQCGNGSPFCRLTCRLSDEARCISLVAGFLVGCGCRSALGSDARAWLQLADTGCAQEKPLQAQFQWFRRISSAHCKSGNSIILLC